MYFHHAYEQVPVSLSDVLDEIIEFSTSHPKELIFLWMNNCAVEDEGKRKSRCDLKVASEITNDASESMCTGGFTGLLKEGSGWCYSSMKIAKAKGIPIQSGCQPMPPLLDDYTHEDYKSIAAGHFGELRTPEGATTTQVSEAKGGIFILHGTCADNGGALPTGTVNFADLGGGKLGASRDKFIHEVGPGWTPKESGYVSKPRQLQAFWQQSDTKIGVKVPVINGIAIPGGGYAIGLIRVSRTLGLNNAMLDAFKDGQKMADSRYFAMSINDICYKGTELAEANHVSAEISDADKAQCRKACDDADRYMAKFPDDKGRWAEHVCNSGQCFNQVCPFMYEGNYNQKAECEDKGLGCTYHANSHFAGEYHGSNHCRRPDFPVPPPEGPLEATAVRALSVNHTVSEKKKPIHKPLQESKRAPPTTTGAGEKTAAENPVQATGVTELNWAGGPLVENGRCLP